MKITNKIKRVALVLISVHFITNVSSQTIKWGTKNQNPFHTDQFLPQILGEDEANFYTYATHGRTSELSLEAYNKNNGNQIYSVELHRAREDRHLNLRKVVLTSGKILTFFSELNDEKTKNEIYVNIYNAKTGKIEKEHVSLFFEETNKDYSRIHIYQSPDRSKILINYYTFNTSKNQIYSKFILYNENLKELVRRENTYDNKRRDVRLHYTLDNNGNLYFLKSKIKSENYIVSYDVENDYEKWEEKIQLNNLDADINSVITDLSLKINDSNELVIYGLYSKNSTNINSKGLFDGYFYIKIDKTSKEIIQETLTLIDESLLKETKANMGKKEMSFNLKTTPLINGESIVCSEFSVYPNESSKIRYTDLIVSKLKSTGEIVWTLRVPKRQLYTSPNSQLPKFYKPYYSYTSFVDSDNLFILFNDNVKNDFSIRDTYEMKSMNSPKSSKIAIYSIDLETGKFKTSSLNGNIDNNVAMMAKLGYQKKQAENSYIFSRSKKGYLYGVFSK